MPGETYVMAFLCVVYHLPKQSGNFGWNVNGKANLVFPNGQFPEKTRFLEGSTKFPNGIFKRKMYVIIVPCYYFQAFWLLSVPVEMSVEMEHAHSVEISIRGFDASHRCSTNQFFQF